MPAAAKGYNVFFGFSSDFKNVSVPFDCGHERVVAVRAECFSEAFQLVVGERLFGKMNLIAQPWARICSASAGIETALKLTPLMQAPKIVGMG